MAQTLLTFNKSFTNGLYNYKHIMTDTIFLRLFWSLQSSLTGTLSMMIKQRHRPVLTWATGLTSP